MEELNGLGFGFDKRGNITGEDYRGLVAGLGLSEEDLRTTDADDVEIKKSKDAVDLEELDDEDEDIMEEEFEKEQKKTTTKKVVIDENLPSKNLEKDGLKEKYRIDQFIAGRSKSGLILKFTEMYAPLNKKPYIYDYVQKENRIQKLKPRKIDNLEDELDIESDEENSFEKNTVNIAPEDQKKLEMVQDESNLPQISYISESEEEELEADAVEEVLDDEWNDSKIKLVKDVQKREEEEYRERVELIDQYNWEEQISWGDFDSSDSTQRAAEERKKKLEEEQRQILLLQQSAQSDILNLMVNSLSSNRAEASANVARTHNELITVVQKVQEDRALIEHKGAHWGIYGQEKKVTLLDLIPDEAQSASANPKASSAKDSETVLQLDGKNSNGEATEQNPKVNGVTSAENAEPEEEFVKDDTSKSKGQVNKDVAKDGSADTSTTDGNIPSASTTSSQPQQQQQPKSTYYQKKKERERIQKYNENQRQRELLSKKSTATNDIAKQKELEAKKNFSLSTLNFECNEHLKNGDWTDLIIWDHENRPSTEKLKKSQHLILDLNDKNMIFIDSAPKKPLETTEQTEGETSADAALKHENPYNISNDRYYEGSIVHMGAAAVQERKGRHTVVHSVPAKKLEPEYFRTEISKDDLRRLHKSRFNFPIGTPWIIQYKVPKGASKRTKGKEITTKEELTAVDHRVVVMEYIERSPVVLNNNGMGTVIKNYYKKPEDQKEVPNPQDGISILVQSQEELPLLGLLKEGVFFSAMENQMFSAQIFPQPTQQTDFILSVRIMSDGAQLFFIRPLPTYYTVGHTQPNVEIPSGNSRAANIYSRNRLELFIFRTFKELKDRNRQMKIRMEDIKSAFPSMSETSIRKKLKDVAVFTRGGNDNGTWTAKPDLEMKGEEELSKLVTPEMVCQNESTLAGVLRYRDSLVNDGAMTAAYALSFASLHGKDKIKEAIRYVEKENINAPWNKSKNFIKAVEGKEGSNIHLLQVTQQNYSKQEIAKMKQEVQEAVAATLNATLESETALRASKLTDEEAKRILAEMGVNEGKIKRMARAERRLQAQKFKDNEMNTETASRRSQKDMVKNTKFKELLQQVYAKEAAKLQASVPYYDSDDEIGGQSLDIADMRVAELARPIGDEAQEDDEEDLDRELNMALDQSDDEEDIQKALEDELDKSDDESDTQSVSSSSKSKSLSRSSSSLLPQTEKKYMVIKTVQIKQPDGSFKTRVEVVRDQAAVEEYRELEKADRKTKVRKKDKFRLVGDRNESFQTSTRDKRKLQDQFRRWSNERKAIKSGNAEITTTRGKKRAEKAELKKKKEKVPEVTSSSSSSKAKKSRKKEESKEEEQKEKKKVRKSDGGEEKKKKKKPKEHQESTASTSSIAPAEIPKVIEASTPATPGSSLKLKISMNAFAKAQEALSATTDTHKRKRKDEEVEENGFENEFKAQKTIKRRKTVGAEIASILKDITDKMFNAEISLPFRYAVDTQLYPDYRQYVQDPIHLTQIRKKIDDFKYANHLQFLADVEKMINNAKIYCAGRYDDVILCGEELLKLCRREIAAAEPRINELLSKEGLPTPISAMGTSSSIFPIANSSNQSSPQLHNSVIQIDE